MKKFKKWISKVDWENVSVWWFILLLTSFWLVCMLGAACGY